MQLPQLIPGRGAAENPKNRFERLEFAPEPDEDNLIAEEEASPLQTIFLRDTSRTIIARNDSPDVPFSASINPYRGCEHGCIYCYARPSHEYLGFSAGLDFETKIMVKENAPELLRAELMLPKWEPQMLAISGVTDCYQPIERKLKLTRRCLEVLLEFRNPVGIVTKNQLVARDADILSELAKFDCAMVMLSVTTLDESLRKVMEPRTSHPRARLDAVRKLTDAGVPCGVMVAPVIPGLTDSEMPEILAEAAKAGAISAGYVPLRLPGAVAPLFEKWLEQHFPNRVNRVMNRIKSIRGGKVNDPNFGSRMHGEGAFADQIEQLFDIACRKAGLQERNFHLSTAHFRRPQEGQLQLF